MSSQLCSFFFIEPVTDPCLHVFSGPVFALWCEHGHVQCTEQRRTARSAKADHDVGFGQSSHGSVGDGGSLAEQKESRIAFRDVEVFFNVRSILRQVNDPVVHLDDFCVFQIENVGSFREHDGSRVDLGLSFRWRIHDGSGR